MSVEYTIAENRFGSYCVPNASRHRIAARTVLNGGVYEPRTLDFLMQACGTGDVVHAGTYFGDFLPALSKACNRHALVWAFEPSLENYICACRTVELNTLANVVMVHSALGSGPRIEYLSTIDDRGKPLGGASRIDDSPNSAEPREPIRTVTIDDTLPANRDVSVIQLDVEGSERPALEGAIRTIHRCRPVLVVEVSPDSRLFEDNWMAETILHLGYRRQPDLHGNAVFAVQS